MTTTRLGKTVGSVKTPLQEWTYWAELDWMNLQPGFVVVAPSGARMSWHANESDARAEVAHQNGAQS